MIETLNRIEAEGKFFNKVRVSMKSAQLTSYSKVKARGLTPKIKTEVRVSVPIMSLQHCIERSCQGNQSRKRHRRHHIGKKEAKLSRLLYCDSIIHLIDYIIL